MPWIDVLLDDGDSTAGAAPSAASWHDDNRIALLGDPPLIDPRNPCGGALADARGDVHPMKSVQAVPHSQLFLEGQRGTRIRGPRGPRALP